ETIDETIEGAAEESLEEKCMDDESESIPEDDLGITVERDNGALEDEAAVRRM
ncbi:unnamed protein product, partial [Prorocentrum cordatum]